MNGQGKPLPDFMNTNGEWIIENVAFLYHADYSNRSPTTTMTMVAERVDGSHAMGFDSAQLAGAFDIEVEALMQANKNQALIFVGDTDVLPTRGGRKAVAYLFQIGERKASITVETDQKEGAA